jgi:hypothetical protein
LHTTPPTREPQRLDPPRENPDVGRWHDNVARGSRAAEVTLRRYGVFCIGNGTTLTRLAAMEWRETHKVLLDFLTKAQQRGLA